MARGHFKAEVAYYGLVQYRRAAVRCWSPAYGFIVSLMNSWRFYTHRVVGASRVLQLSLDGLFHLSRIFSYSDYPRFDEPILAGAWARLHSITRRISE